MRTPEVGRLYLQVPADEDIARWPDERIWTELDTRFALPGWSLTGGPVLQKSITPMRSFVAAPMRYGNLFLAGDAAHIVPPTGAKGLNLAVADVAALATALIRLIRDGDAELAAAYSDYCLERVWRSTHLSWWMTSMLHIAPDQDQFESELQLAQLRHLVSSRTRRRRARRDLHRLPPAPLRPVHPPGRRPPLALGRVAPPLPLGPGLWGRAREVGTRRAGGGAVIAGVPGREGDKGCPSALISAGQRSGSEQRCRRGR